MKHKLVDINRRILRARRVWFFLDYDGTLAEFAPTPNHIDPDPALIELLNKIIQRPDVRLAIISGRRQSHLETLLPIPELILGGAYGIELRTHHGNRLQRGTYRSLRPPLEKLKRRWEDLISDREGFFLEDKGWTLALHAKHVRKPEAGQVLAAARHLASELTRTRNFCLQSDGRLLEVAPPEAEKGGTVEYLLRHFPWDGALLIYVGDDDKDEKAFKVIQTHGGIPILVASQPRTTEALCRLESPHAVRQWLSELFN